MAQGSYHVPGFKVPEGQEHLSQIVREWLKSHPELATELLQAHIAQLQATKSHLTLVKPDTAPVRHANKRSKLLK